MENPLVSDLRHALDQDAEWSTPQTKSEVATAARRLIRAVDQRTEHIAQMRAMLSPSEEAVSQILAAGE